MSIHRLLAGNVGGIGDPTQQFTSGLNAGQKTAANELQLTKAKNQIAKQNNINRLLQAGAGAQEIAQIDPATGQQILENQALTQKTQNVDKDRILQNLADFGFEQTKKLFPETSIDPSFSVFDNNSPEQLQLRDRFISVKKILKGKGRDGLASAKTEILDDGSVIQALPSGDVQVRDPSGTIVTGDERLSVLKASRQQVLNTLSEKADISVDTEGRKADIKAESQLKFKPQIEAAVTTAKALAKDRGETFTELNQMQAALPSLNETINSLRELAPIATSTLSGNIFDTVTKEAGFGSTEGATAKAKFIAIINNQVLPLLKPTFGAAFTVQEGESLKATMGDPNATPAQKMAQLDAFIAQKIRDIESKQRQLGTPNAQTAPQGGDLTLEEQAELNALEAEFGTP